MSLLGGGVSGTLIAAYPQHKASQECVQGYALAAVLSLALAAVCAGKLLRQRQRGPLEAERSCFRAGGTSLASLQHATN